MTHGSDRDVFNSDSEVFSQCSYTGKLELSFSQCENPHTMLSMLLNDIMRMFLPTLLLTSASHDGTMTAILVSRAYWSKIPNLKPVLLVAERRSFIFQSSDTGDHLDGGRRMLLVDFEEDGTNLAGDNNGRSRCEEQF